MTSINYAQICRKILSLDKDIRFAGIAIMEGKIVAAQYRENFTPLLTREESELSFMQALIRMNTRKTVEHRIGKTLFSITEYEKVIRSTVMIYDEHNRYKLGNEFVLLLSFEKHSPNPFQVIKEKIQPFIQDMSQNLAR